MFVLVGSGDGVDICRIVKLMKPGYVAARLILIIWTQTHSRSLKLGRQDTTIPISMCLLQLLHLSHIFIFTSKWNREAVFYQSNFLSCPNWSFMASTTTSITHDLDITSFGEPAQTQDIQSSRLWRWSGDFNNPNMRPYLTHLRLDRHSSGSEVFMSAVQLALQIITRTLS